MTTKTARVIEREVTIRETIHEVEIHEDEPTPITRAFGAMRRLGPRRSTRTIDVMPTPLLTYAGAK